MKSQETQERFPGQIITKTQKNEILLAGQPPIMFNGLKENVSKIKSKLSDMSSA